jgi:hypothetical protein
VYEWSERPRKCQRPLAEPSNTIHSARCNPNPNNSLKVLWKVSQGEADMPHI